MKPKTEQAPKFDTDTEHDAALPPSAPPDARDDWRERYAADQQAQRATDTRFDATKYRRQEQR